MNAQSKRHVLIAVELVVAANAYGGAWWGFAGAKNVPREWRSCFGSRPRDALEAGAQ
jgi:hypothetical protein